MTNEDEKLKSFLREDFESVRLPEDFTESVMADIAQLKRESKIYQPLISEKIWKGIALFFIILMTIPFFMVGGEAGYNWLEKLNLNPDILISIKAPLKLFLQLLFILSSFIFLDAYLHRNKGNIGNNTTTV